MQIRTLTMRIAFKMQLNHGQKAEYKKRHDEIWPELKELLKRSGIKEYSIFLDEDTDSLFGVLQVENEKVLDDLPKDPVMQKWWTYMKDIMATNPDHSPISFRLKEVFYLP